jgi:two-component system cell cycle sensor histidine kinase/response regulator CckA
LLLELPMEAVGNPGAYPVILLAEDDVVVRNLVRLMLTREGYTVLTAKDGQEALRTCQAFQDPLHLLLTDMLMPHLDGMTLTARVKELRPQIKVILMTGFTIDEILTGNRPDAMLRKPFVPPTLLKCIKKVLAADGPVECEQ